MSLNVFCRRLALAIIVPVILVTATLYPIFRAHLDARLDGATSTADALLEAGHRTLQKDINASINHLLATAEMPLLKRYLDDVGVAQSPPLEAATQLTKAQVHALFGTLLPHYARYAQLSLIDLNGRALLSVGHAGTPPAGQDANAVLLQEVSWLAPRDVYLSSPRRRLPHESGPSVGGPVMDVATPVYDTDGIRKGILRFTLDWPTLASHIQQTMELDAASYTLLVDARGTWLLDETQGSLPFSGDFASYSPEIWKALLQRHHGKTDLGEQLVMFQAYDARIQHYQSQAGMVTSEPGRQPWRLGIVMTKPSLATLLSEDETPLFILLLLYLLSIAFGVYWAISHQRQRALRRQAQRLSHEAHQYALEVRDLYENAPCGYHSLNADGQVVKMNRTELAWLGYSAEEVIEKRNYRDFVTPETRQAFETAFQAVLGPEREGAAECELLTRSGETLPVVIQATAYITHHGFVHSRAMVFDLSERKQMEEALARQAMTDPLTGLGNRRYLHDHAAREMARARRSGAPLSLIAIDLDHFKRINDEYGHDVGDLVLQAFARTAQGLLREGDVLCRMGGEEFVALLPDTPLEQAMQVAERLRQALENAPVEVGQEGIDNHLLRYTASLGVTAVDMEESSLKPAIKRADSGLYEAKAQGRNRVVRM